MKKFILTAALAITTLFAINTTALAGPKYGYSEWYDEVGPNQNDTYYVDVEGDGYSTLVTLDGYCPNWRYDIDLWIYENGNLLAKRTGDGCFHQITLHTKYNRRGTLEIVVENQKKPYWTEYSLTVDYD